MTRVRRPGSEAAAGEAGLSAGLIEEPIRHMARSLELTRELTREMPDRPALMAAIVRYARAINFSGRIAESAALLEPAQ